MRYLLITYLRKPNGQIDEQVGVSRNIKTNDIQTCSVILDFKEQKVEKCVIEGQVINKPFSDLKEYYETVYPDVISRIEQFHKKGA